MSDERPLQGKRIAVTRPFESCQGVGKILESLGASVLAAPAIRRLPPTAWTSLDQGIEALLRGDYFGVLFTSPAAVQPFWLRLVRSGGTLASLDDLLIGAVGGGTAAALERLGLPVDVRPVQEDGAALAAAVADHMGASLRGARFLQPRAEEGREELAAGLRRGGAEVDVVAAYRTVRASPEELLPLVQELRSGALDAVIFASPSAAEAVHGALSGASLEHAKSVAIGRTTAKAVADRFGIEATVAERADDEALAQAVLRALG